MYGVYLMRIKPFAPARFPSAALAAALSAALLATYACAHEAKNGDVRIVSALDSGGSVQSVGDVRIAGFAGAPGVVAAGGDIVVRQGGTSMIYYAAAFAVDADSLTIDEQGAPEEENTRTALRGNVVFDDGSVAAVDGPQVAWAAPEPDSALASVSAAGVAQAGAVYQNTAAWFSGTYAGLSATSSITVLNLLPDNYLVWAGDTFNDAWEIAKGMSGAVDPDATNNGVPNWQLYAMGFNPAQPATQALAAATTTNGYLAIAYTRNPYATNYAFTPQESGNFNLGFGAMVDPVSVTNTADGIEHIITRGSVPIAVTNRQFLRVEITRPPP